MQEELDQYFSEASNESIREVKADSFESGSNNHTKSNIVSTKKTKVYLYFILFIASLLIIFIIIKNNFFSELTKTEVDLNIDNTITATNSKQTSIETSENQLEERVVETNTFSKELLNKLGIINKLPADQDKVSLEESQEPSSVVIEDEKLAQEDNQEIKSEALQAANQTNTKLDQTSDQNDYLITPFGLTNSLGSEEQDQYFLSTNRDIKNSDFSEANALGNDNIIYLSNDPSVINNTGLKQQNAFSTQETSRLEEAVSNLDQAVKEKNIKKIWTVQLAAFKSLKESKLKWRRILTDQANLVDGYVSYVEINEDKTIYRLRIGEFSNYELAQKYCSALQNNLVECFVISK